MAENGTSERGERRPARGYSGGDRAEPGERGAVRGHYQRRRVCAFCVDKVETIDYKEVNALRRFLSEQGQILSRRKTGTCARHQRRLTIAIKRARLLALLPYTAEHIRKHG